jgi:hypothetical protein
MSRRIRRITTTRDFVVRELRVGVGVAEAEIQVVERTPVQRELDAEPETTSTCFDCGHRSQRPMTIETTEGTAQVGEPDDAVTDHLLSGGDDELPPELRTAAEVASTGSKGGSKGRRLCGRI